MRVLVCGGRTYKDKARVFQVLDQFNGDNAPITSIIEGEAPGADLLAASWASARRIHLDPFPADWDKLGLGAGPIRNRQMLIEGRPDVVIAFPGKDGTAEMVKQARRAGIRVIEVV